MNDVNYRDITAALERITPFIHRTPVLTSRYFDEKLSTQLFFKCENLQKTGAFKVRGAVNSVLSLSPEKLALGVATHSSGNHGAALSYSGAMKNIKVHVVMPNDAAQAKKNAVRDYGGIVVECVPGAKSRQQTLDDVLNRTGAHMVHPYNDSLVIAGQGTCALELMEQCGDLDCIIAPIGGGGLISGTCIAAKMGGRKIKVYGVEPKAADDAFRSLKSGQLLGLDAPTTVADGLKAPLKDLTWGYISRYVDDIFTVSESEILSAMKLVMERMKIVIEPSSAVVVAALLQNQTLFANKKIGVILSGGNIDLAKILT